MAKRWARRGVEADLDLKPFLPVANGIEPGRDAQEGLGCRNYFRIQLELGIGALQK